MLFKKKLLILFLSNLILLSIILNINAIAVWLKITPFYQMNHVQYHNEQFNVLIPDVNYAHTKPKKIKAYGDIVSIKFDFFLDRSSESEYELLKITNQNIRSLVLNYNNLTQKLVIALPTSSANDQMLLLPNVLKGIWHKVEIIIWNNHKCYIKIDDNPMTRFLNTEIVDENINLNPRDLSFGDIKENKSLANLKIKNFNFKVINLNDAKIKKIKKIIIILLSILLTFFSVKLVSCYKQITRVFKIEFITTFVLLGFFINVVVNYIGANYYYLPYPKDSFLLKVIGGHFGDFLVSLLVDMDLNPYHSELLKGEYFPFSYILIYPFVLINSNLALTMFLFSFVYFLFSFVSRNFSLNNEHQAKSIQDFRNFFILTFMTFPFLFSFERANLEILLFVCILFFIENLKKKRVLLSAVFLGVSGAIKLYPLFFGLLYLNQKKYKEFIFSIFITCLLTFISLFFLKPDFQINVQDVFYGLKNINYNCVMLPDNCIQFSNSIWALIKLELYKNNFSREIIVRVNNYYQGSIILIVLLVISPIIVFTKHAFWKKIMLISSLRIPSFFKCSTKALSSRVVSPKVH